MRPKLKTALTTLAVVVVVAGGLLALSGNLTLSRLDTVELGCSNTDLSSAGRFSIWQVAFDMIGQRPWLGHGYGSFLDMFYLNRDDRFTVIFDMAHDTYIEHLVELGIPATILLYTGPVLLFGMCVRGVFNRRRDQVVPARRVQRHRPGRPPQPRRLQPADPRRRRHLRRHPGRRLRPGHALRAHRPGLPAREATRSPPLQLIPAKAAALPPSLAPPRPAALPPGPGGTPQPTEA